MIFVRASAKTYAVKEPKHTIGQATTRCAKLGEFSSTLHNHNTKNPAISTSQRIARKAYLNNLKQVGLEQLVIEEPQVVLDQQVLLQRLPVLLHRRVEIFQRSENKNRRHQTDDGV